MLSKSKVYLAGKITGDPNYKQKFGEVEKMLTEQGYRVINPAILPPGLTDRDYMKICFEFIDAADVVVFLDDWKESKGARLEYDYVMYTHKSYMTTPNLLFKLGG